MKLQLSSPCFPSLTSYHGPLPLVELVVWPVACVRGTRQAQRSVARAFLSYRRFLRWSLFASARCRSAPTSTGAAQCFGARLKFVSKVVRAGALPSRFPNLHFRDGPSVPISAPISEPVFRNRPEPAYFRTCFRTCIAEPARTGLFPNLFPNL